jgi:hypothetical protein
MSVTAAVAEMKRALERKGYQVEVTPRKALDWPCFFCGKSLTQCKKLGTCCRRCKGKKEKFRAH